MFVYYQPFFFFAVNTIHAVTRHDHRSVHVVKLLYRKQRQGSLYGAVHSECPTALQTNARDHLLDEVHRIFLHCS